MNLTYVYSMFLVLLAITVFITPADTLAQEMESIKISPANGQLNSSLRKKAYRYPTFQDGKVTFINGTFTLSKLNYNVLTGEVEFINSKEDTLALDNLFTIGSIAIGEDMFFYDQEGKNLLKLLSDYNSTQLLVKEKYELTNIRNKGALGVESNHLPATNASQAYDNGNLYELGSNASLQYSVKTSYYFTDMNAKFLQANKRNTARLFPQHKDAVNQYLKENKVDFKDEESLKVLLEFMSSLPRK